MNRIKAILRCLYHAAEPPAIERWRRGYCHYQDPQGLEPGENPVSWWDHCKLNLWHAWRLVTFAKMSERTMKFHGID